MFRSAPISLTVCFVGLPAVASEPNEPAWHIPRNRMTHEAGVYCISCSHDGSVLASGSHDRTIKLWGLETRKEVSTLKGHHGPVTSVAFSPDGNVLASGGWDGTTRLWDMRTRTEKSVLRGHTNKVTSAVFSPDGKTLATRSLNDEQIILWAIEANGLSIRGKRFAVIREPKSRHLSNFSLAFSPDGTALAWLSSNRIKLLEIKSRSHGRTKF